MAEQSERGEGREGGGEGREGMGQAVQRLVGPGSSWAFTLEEGGSSEGL